MNTPVVLELPAELHPVALAGADLPTRTWGVVAVHDGRTIALDRGLPNGAVAQHRAERAAATGEVDQVYLVYRCPQAVTVHTRDYGHAGNTLGTLPVDSDDGITVADAWAHVVNATTTDPARNLEHVARVAETMRVVHGLPAGAPDRDIIAAAMADPKPRGAYLVTHVRLMFAADAVHQHAERRALAQHVPAEKVDPYVRQLAAAVAAPYQH